jgi:hypothetical protein
LLVTRDLNFGVMKLKSGVGKRGENRVRHALHPEIARKSVLKVVPGLLKPDISHPGATSTVHFDLISQPVPKLRARLYNGASRGFP